MDTISFWKRVKYLIRTHNTSQEKIAGYVGIPYGTFRNWIYKDWVPDLQTACNLAVALGVSVEYLVWGNERDAIKERMDRLQERKTAAKRINMLAREIVDQSSQI